MQASYAGPLASYNSLTDEHLSEYFSNPRVFKHLRRMGLISRDGRIVDEGIIRVNNARKEHNARSKGVLATSIINRAIEIERKRRGELKKKLELLEKYEIVEKVKSQKLHPAGIQEFNPYRTVPPPPPRLSTTMDMHFDKLSLSLDQISDMRHLVGKVTRGKSIPPHRSKSPYEDEFASRYSTPVPRPPSTPRPSTATNVRGRRSTIRSRPSTAPAGARMGSRQTTQRQILTKSQPVHSNVSITLKFIGTGLHLGTVESSLSDVMVVQQHCGGNTVTLYKGKVKPREIFTFVSKRHIGMPYGLTIYLDGLMDSRVSACCEYRHQCGMLLGSKTAHFKLVRIEGGTPCYRCEIEMNKKYLKEKQDREIEMVLGETSSMQELGSPQESASNRDEEPPVIDTSPVHLTSQTSQADNMDQLECQKSVDTLRQGSPQQEHIEEKTSLASHSNASVASVESRPSRVSVASSKSSVRSHESVASTKNSSSKSSRTSLQSPTSVEPKTADADTQYNYEDDNFEEPEEIDSEESKQQPEVGQLEDSDPELKGEKELSDSDRTKELNTEDPTHQTEQQSNSTDPALGEEGHDTKPNDGTDIGHSAEYNYEGEKFEDTNPEETDEPEKEPKELTADTNPVTPPSSGESAEGSEEIAREISAPIEGSEEKESRTENKNADSSNDIETQDVTTDSYDAEVKVPSHQDSSDDTNREDLVNPESDKTVPKFNNEEPGASKAGSEDIKDGSVSGDQTQASMISDDTQDAQIDQADVSKEPQGILLNSTKRKSAGLSVSFEAGSQSAAKEGKQQGAQGEQEPAKDLSASSTIEEAKKILQKSQSTASLGSLLNEKESTPAESELDLSGSEDEDIPDLEQKISDLIDGDSSQTENKTESHENAEAGEGEKEHVDGASSEVLQKATLPQPVSKSEKETDGADDRSELQAGSETAATLPLSEKEMDGAEEKSELQEESTETAMVPGSKKETAENTEDAETAIVLENEKGSFEQPGEEMKSDETPTSSQTGISKEVANQERTIENQGSADTAQAETPKQVAEVTDEAAPVDIPPTNSKTETAKEAEPSEEDTTINQEAKAGTHGEEERAREGEPELGSVAAESADINDIGSVKSGLSSSSSKSSLTSVSSQGSQKS